MANSTRFLLTLGLTITMVALNVASATTKFTETNAVVCANVTKQLAPCLTYVTGKDPKPSAGCCTGAKAVAEEAKTTPDKQAVCTCLKIALAKVKGADYAKINDIPKACGIEVTLPPITKDTDCKTIQLKGMFA